MAQSSKGDLIDSEQVSVVQRPRRNVSMLTVIGILLLAAGLSCLGWVAWQYFGTNITSEKAFKQETTQLRQVWEQPAKKKADKSAEGELTPTVIPGDAIALLRIPAFGPDYEVPILSGTDLSVLERGVGHYTNSVLPGEIGNFSVAGHRVTHGEPFRRLLELNKGDQIIVETRDKIYTYVMDDSPRNLTVTDTETWVLDPNPHEPGAAATEAVMTLTTCQDLFRTPDRSVGFAHLIKTTKK
ncbi:MAG: class E sortase [Microlunatus sp.]